MSVNREAHFFAAVRLKSYTSRLLLPHRRWTHCVRHILQTSLADGLAQHRFTKTQLIHHRIESVCASGNSTIGNVIAIPTSSRIEGIKIRKIELGHTPRTAIDHHPSGTLPLPVRPQLSVFR